MKTEAPALDDALADTLAGMLAGQDDLPVALEDTLAALLDAEDEEVEEDLSPTDAAEAEVHEAPVDGTKADRMLAERAEEIDDLLAEDDAAEDALDADDGFDWDLDEDEDEDRSHARFDEDDEDDWDDADGSEVAAIAEDAMPAEAATAPLPEAEGDAWEDLSDDADAVPAAAAAMEADEDEDADWDDVAESPAPATARSPISPADNDDDWDALADEWGEGDTAEDDTAEDDTAEAIPVVPAAQPGRTPLRARVIKVKRAIFDRAVQSGQIEEIKDKGDARPAPRPAAQTSLSAEEEDELARELAAVKAELSGQLEDWDAEDEDQDEDREGEILRSAAAQAPAAPGWDDAEDENDADAWDEQRPVRGIADDWDDEDDEGQDGARTDDTPLRLEHPVARQDMPGEGSSALEGARKAVKMASPARALLTEQTIEDFDASRILEQTNEELEEPEGNRRRSAIAHLRAAVAATRADRLLGRKRDTEEEAEPYREDLATVVRPRRPQPATGRTDRPAEVQRPAPLKLVAEQRIPGTTQSEPVRPRRVSRAETEAPEPRSVTTTGDDFAAYAERMGAQDLPELLEAAAAYMSFVEGRDQFSRPQLMTTMRQAELTEFEPRGPAAQLRPALARRQDREDLRWALHRLRTDQLQAAQGRLTPTNPEPKSLPSGEAFLVPRCNIRSPASLCVRVGLADALEDELEGQRPDDAEGEVDQQLEPDRRPVEPVHHRHRRDDIGRQPDQQDQKRQPLAGFV